MPHHVALWVTVQEQERRAAAIADAGEDAAAGRFDPA
jgi:hypothetical protein